MLTYQAHCIAVLLVVLVVHWGYDKGPVGRIHSLETAVPEPEPEAQPEPVANPVPLAPPVPFHPIPGSPVIVPEAPVPVRVAAVPLEPTIVKVGAGPKLPVAGGREPVKLTGPGPVTKAVPLILT